MPSNLINSVATLAQSIVNESGLPLEANDLKQHAQEFSQKLAPQLEKNVQNIGHFCQNYASQERILNTLLDAWKGGNSEAQLQMLPILTILSSTLSDVMKINQAVFYSLSQYRETIAGDSRAMAVLENQLTAKMSSLQMQSTYKQEELENTAKKLAAIAWFPLAWIITEIVNLSTKKKLLEQEIIDLGNDLRDTSRQIADASHALNTVKQFENALQLLVASLQNLINGVSITNGQMQQVVETLEHSQQESIQIVVRAYLETLNRQIQTIHQYLLV
ncbi:hypothetical protein [Nostoc sp. C057]|uniref:hypothetical protein n=1 Tax=Nostoc sp. C057 TaxID=2576903 RepID=UPI0015C2C2B6|nr:hypothetical protein [Nostoc sp. C057]